MGNCFNDLKNNVDNSYVLNSDNISQVPSSNVSIDSKLIRIKGSGDSNSTCGECMRKIVKNAHFITCNHCELDFHVKCINNDNIPNANCNTWFCNNCFFKVSNDELPFRETFIDFNCSISKGFKIAHLNIQSVRFKVDNLKILLVQNHIDILCITESWLDCNIGNNEIQIDGYNICRLDRIHKGHGGILYYIKDGIVFKEKSDLQNTDVESLWIELNLPFSKPILLGTVYRPPDSKAEYNDKLDILFQNTTSDYEDVAIVGDFNLDISKRCNASKIKKLSTHSNLSQLINDYTRITETTKSKLDLAFVSKPDKISCSGVHSLGLSDHSLIYIVRKNNKVKVPPKFIKSRSFKKLNEHAFIDSIKQTNWKNVMNEIDVDNAYNTFQSMFDNVCDVHCPIKEKRIKGSFPEWINGDYIKLCKDRDFYYSRAHKSNDEDDWKMARQLRNKVNKLNRSLKKSYCNKAINENVNNSKKLWSTIKKLIPKNTSSISSVQTHDGFTSNDKETADQFNSYFTSIGNNLAAKFKCNNDGCDNVNICKNDTDIQIVHFEFDVITPDFVFEQICNFSNDKSTGVDNMCIRLLKLAAPIICHPLAYICNLSLFTSKFPSRWKVAKVTPIYKDGDKSDVNNYRPISVLPILSKILERAVHDQLYNYLSCNNILNPCQSGFRTNHSTNTTLIDVSDHILNNMNNGKVTGAIFLDLRKAFDTVSHKLLLKKLHSNGIIGNTLKWFQSYLENRTQTVNINSTLISKPLILGSHRDLSWDPSFLLFLLIHYLIL